MQVGDKDGAGGMMRPYDSQTAEETDAGHLLLGFTSCSSSMQSPGSGAEFRSLSSAPARQNAGLGGGAVVKAEIAAGTSTGAVEGVPADRAAAAWIEHLEAGRSVPDSKTLIDLLKALLESRSVLRPISSGRPDVKLVQVDTGKKFPHMLDTANGTLTEDEAIWTQANLPL